MSTLIDQAERDRFVAEQSRNISVIAPAGVGKTHAIVERIVRLASGPEAEAVERLQCLVVVTYSVRAAQQMQQRARAAIREAAVSARVQRAFQQAFFGTIHSYCVRLLDRFGHYLGLPSPIGLLQADDELWNRFLLRGLKSPGLPMPHVHELVHFYAPEKLYALGREMAPGPVIDPGAIPLPNCQPLLDYRDNALKPAALKSIQRGQAALKQWNESWAAGDRFHPLPACPNAPSAPQFLALWETTLAPLHSWLREAALAFARDIANAYEEFRIAEAVMTYDDQVRIALRALDHPAVQRELAAEQWSVLLDEAQDTDPRQFEVLLRVAGLRDGAEQAPEQSFSIVGDFQQAIYAPRSDLSVYRRVHEALSTGPRGTQSRLKVTFRCDRAIIDFVNRVFPTVLDNTAGQCDFVPLVPRDDAGEGKAVRWPCPDEPAHQAGEEIKAEVRARHEARFLAGKLRALGPAGLGARDWSEIAILCPRKNWLLEIQHELVEAGLPVQLHSSNEQQRERTPAAWLTALVWIAAHPEDSFEVAGVLREIFGVSDHDMAIFTRGKGDRLRLDGPAPEGEGSVQTALKVLREACAGADTRPLHQTVQRLVTQTHLLARLKAIPDLRPENAARELDDLRALVSARCAQGVLLVELAEELRLGLDQVYPAEEEIRNAIQLLTSHKSKGLEWQVVILPYLFRSIELKTPSYPRLVQVEEGREQVCRDKGDYTGPVRDFVEGREKQQLQRLLYVMCTRAKRTLLLIDDEELFSGGKPRPGWPAAKLLDFSVPNGANRETWKALPEELSEVKAAPVPKSVLSQRISVPAPLTREDLRHAVREGEKFTRRITPHALARHAADEAEPEIALEREEEQPVDAAGNPGILYGTWWHELVETIPWHQPAAAWQKKFKEALALSPDPARSRKEWKLFVDSAFARWMTEPGRLVQNEIPFLFLDAGKPCIEGVMDLAVFARDESIWHVIDWKTNRLGPAGSSGLVEVYRGQIAAYVRTLHDMLGLEVRGSLYLTQTGEWIDVA